MPARIQTEVRSSNTQAGTAMLHGWKFVTANYCKISALVLLFGVALRALLSYKTDFSIGDSYIGFRFAEQFAAGNGLVFNAGENVGGNTSILYSLLLGLGALGGIAIPLVARSIGIVCDVLTFLLLQDTLKRDSDLRSPLAQILAPALIFLCPMLFLYSVSGMETPLYILSIVFLLNRTIKGVDAKWYAAMAILVFTRPDGILAIIACLAYLTIANRKIPYLAFAGTFVAGALYLGYNHYNYGSILPLTVKTKAVVFHHTIAQNVQYISDRFYFHRQWLFFAYLAATGLLVVRFRKKKAVLLLGFASAAYLLFMLFAPYVRTWYAVPFLTTSACALAFSLAHLSERIGSPRTRQSLQVAVFTAYLLASAYGYRVVFHECGIWRERIREQQESAGTWIRNHTDSDAKIFVTALETGYFAKRHTWDHPGLVSPRVLEMVEADRTMSLLEIAKRLDVDYAVLPEEFVNKPHPAFIRLESFGTKLRADRMGLGEGSYTIYERKPESR